MGWRNLVGTIGYSAGASGTVTIPVGACVLSIVVHSTAGGTLTMFNGASFPIIAAAAPITLQFRHTLWQSRDNTPVPGSQNLVFTGTDSYFVEWIKSGNT